MIFEYLRAGFALTSIPVGKKGPTHSKWNLPENAVTTIEGAAKIKANVGLLHAYCRPTATCAIDLDNYIHAKTWFKEYGVDINQLLLADDAVVISSGKKFSLKLLYRLPVGVGPLESKKILGPDGKSALEFRCADKAGKTVQDVLPPSVHPLGSQYEWVGKGDWRKTTTIPPGLLRIWQQEIKSKKSPKQGRKSQVVFSNAIDDTPRQRTIFKSILDHISADCSYDVYRDIVWAILSIGWVDAEELARQWCMTAPNRFDADSFDVIVANYDERRTPTYGTLKYYAKQGGWHE
jgi:putative DNA primase/helicase